MLDTDAHRGAGGSARSGKSTYLERLGAAGLSSDSIRQLLADDESDQTIHDRVFETLRYLLRQRLALARPVTYIDATNLTLQETAPLHRHRGRLRLPGGGAVLRYAAGGVPRTECPPRARGPVRSPCQMEERLVPPTTAEGFTRVSRVSDVDPPASRP